MSKQIITAALALIAAAGIAEAGNRWSDRGNSAVSVDANVGRHGSLLDLDAMWAIAAVAVAACSTSMRPWAAMAAAAGF